MVVEDISFIQTTDSEIEETDLQLNCGAMFPFCRYSTWGGNFRIPIVYIQFMKWVMFLIEAIVVTGSCQPLNCQV